MKYLFIFLITVLGCGLVSCSKGGNTPPADVAPTNLVINAVVSTDLSGNVEFTATATGAATYEFDYGNGVFAIVPTGKVTYKYPATGVYTVKVLAKSAGGKITSGTKEVSVTVNQSLIWSDEFDNNGAPDASKWGYDIGTGSGGWGNNEVQYYTNRLDNAIVSNGTLKIIAKKEAFSGSAYTSARLLSRGKFSFQYGKVEVRAKIPTGVGTWPAVWMLGDNIGTAGWPACGEIDIMEHKGSDLNKIFGTLHFPGNSGGNARGGTTNNPTATTAFHRYFVEWNASSIKFWIDDNPPFFTFANNSNIPFNHKFFLLLNLAMGGTFGGSVDPNFSNATLEIDYVRVYQ
ncbi:MAG: family 16 glycosylhydrolase [Chitinophagaceae bacterium]